MTVQDEPRVIAAAPPAAAPGADIACAIVMPIYEDSEASARLMLELRAALGAGAYVVAVDDGSVRQPVGVAALHAAGLRGVVLRLRRNVGHQRAISAGLGYAAEHLPDCRCVVMDSDGEDMPASIPSLLARLDDVDVVVAQRKRRLESPWFKLFYQLYKFMFQLLTGRPISFGNFMALAPLAVRRLAAMHEVGTHVAASVLISKLRLAYCPLDRGPRYAGRSKMNFSSLVLHGCRALMIFAEDVLLRIGLLSFAIALLSVLSIVLAVLLKAFGLATPGWFSVALGILLLVLLQTSALALMTLMLTGIVRGGNPVAPDWRVLVDRVIVADV